MRLRERGEGLWSFYDPENAMVEVLEPKLKPPRRIVFVPLDKLRIVRASA